MSIGNFNLADDIAYHLDAELFGKYLRDEHCIPNGVIHKLTEIKDIKLNSDGSISKLITVDNDNIKSDLELTTLTMNRVSKEVTKLIKAPISSYIAKRWMASERKAKRR